MDYGCWPSPGGASGFRKGKRIMDHLFVLQSAIHLRLRQSGGKTYAIFVDFRRAFDSIPQNKLWENLHRFGFSSKVIRIIKKLYDLPTLQI